MHALTRELARRRLPTRAPLPIARCPQGEELPGVLDEDAPGGGRHYCVPCARHFTAADVLTAHCRTRPHRRRLRDVAQPQYTQAEADAGAGCSGSVAR